MKQDADTDANANTGTSTDLDVKIDMDAVMLKIKQEEERRKTLLKLQKEKEKREFNRLTDKLHYQQCNQNRKLLILEYFPQSTINNIIKQYKSNRKNYNYRMSYKIDIIKEMCQVANREPISAFGIFGIRKSTLEKMNEYYDANYFAARDVAIDLSNATTNANTNANDDESSNSYDYNNYNSNYNRDFASGYRYSRQMHRLPRLGIRHRHRRRRRLQPRRRKRKSKSKSQSKMKKNDGVGHGHFNLLNFFEQFIQDYKDQSLYNLQRRLRKRFGYDIKREKRHWNYWIFDCEACNVGRGGNSHIIRSDSNISKFISALDHQQPENYYTRKVKVFNYNYNLNCIKNENQGCNTIDDNGNSVNGKINGKSKGSEMHNNSCTDEEKKHTEEIVMETIDKSESSKNILGTGKLFERIKLSKLGKFTNKMITRKRDINIKVNTNSSIDTNDNTNTNINGTYTKENKEKLSIATLPTDSKRKIGILQNVDDVNVRNYNYKAKEKEVTIAAFDRRSLLDMDADNKNFDNTDGIRDDVLELDNLDIDGSICSFSMTIETVNNINININCDEKQNENENENEMEKNNEMKIDDNRKWLQFVVQTDSVRNGCGYDSNNTNCETFENDEKESDKEVCHVRSKPFYLDEDFDYVLIMQYHQCFCSNNGGIVLNVKQY